MPYLAIIGLGVTQIIHWGSLYYAIAVLAPAMRHDLALSSEAVFAGMSMALGASSLIARYAGRSIDRNGGKLPMACGSALAALGLVILSQAQGLGGYVAGWLVIGLAMPFTLYDAAFPSLAQIAGGEARRAITYLSFAGGFASTIFWPFTSLLQGQFGWRGALLVFAALSVTVCLPVHALLLKGGAKAGEAAHAGTPGQLPEAARARAFLLLALAILLQSLVSAGLPLHILIMFQELGLSAPAAIFVGTLFGPAQVAGRIGEMIFGTRRSPLHSGLLAWGLLPLAFAVALLFGVSFTTAAILAVLYGVSNGLATIAKGTIPLVLFGSTGYGGQLGRLGTPARIAAAISPLAFAAINAYGGALAGFYVATAIALAGFAAMLALSRNVAKAG